MGVVGGYGEVDDPKGDGVYECSEDPGEIFHKKPACGVLWNFDVTPVILSIYLVSHPMGWILIVTIGKGNGGKIPYRYSGRGRSYTETDIYTGPDLQTRRTRNPKAHDNGRRLP